MQLVEIQRGIDLQAYLTAEFTEKGRLLKDIADELGVDIGTVSRWKDHFGLERRAEAS
jgi:DNA-binding MarR family transcriptional regulator